MSTADAYGWVAAARGSYTPVPRIIPPSQLASWEALAPLVVNDFEPAVAARHPELTSILGALRRAGAALAQLSGSGSTVYGVFAAPPDCRALEQTVPGRVVLTQTIERISPVELIGAAR
ncbi:MAG: hypothetical protein IRY91_09935 [Gemmatimonadaceae bacterium]|nr:hypothetical protein [Gemmatimonadaceae bacterium]